jgi:hypothetical protein
VVQTSRGVAKMGRTARSVLAGLAVAAMLAVGAPAWAASAGQAEPARTELLRRAQAGDVSAYDLLADSYLNAEAINATSRRRCAGSMRASRRATPAA